MRVEVGAHFATRIRRRGRLGSRAWIESRFGTNFVAGLNIVALRSPRDQRDDILLSNFSLTEEVLQEISVTE